MKSKPSRVLRSISLSVIAVCLLILIVTGIFGIGISNRLILILAGITLVMFPIFAWTFLRDMRGRFEGVRHTEKNE